MKQRDWRCGTRMLAALILLGAGTLRAQDAPGPIEPAAVDLGRPVDFEEDIYPLLDLNCIACHNLAISESKFNLEDVPSLMKGGKRGPAVVPGKPDESLLYQVAARTAEPHMPPLPNKVEAEAFTPDDLGLLRQWILEGASQGAGPAVEAMTWQSMPQSLQAIYTLTLSPHGRFVACGRANQIDLYDLATHQYLGRLADPHLAALEQNGQPMYPGGASHRDFVHSLAFSPDGQWLASGGYRIVKLWRRDDPIVDQWTPASAVTALAAADDGSRTVVGLADGTVLVRKDGEPPAPLARHESSVGAVAISAGGAFIATSAGASIRLQDQLGKAFAHWRTPSDVRAVVFGSVGQLVSAHADGQIRLWELTGVEGADPADAQSPTPRTELGGHAGEVTSLAWLGADRQTLVSGSADGTVRIWSLSDGKVVATMKHEAPVRSVAVRPDGERIASVGGPTVRLWDAAGKSLSALKSNLSVTRLAQQRREDESVAEARFDLAEAAKKTEEANVKQREEALKTAREAVTAAEKKRDEAQSQKTAADEALQKVLAELEENADDKELSKRKESAAKEVDEKTKALASAETALAQAVRTVEQTSDGLDVSRDRLAEVTARLTQEEERFRQAAAAETAASRELSLDSSPSIQDVAFSADGTRLAAITSDGILLVASSNGTPLEELSTLDGSTAAAPLISMGNRFLTGGDRVSTWSGNPSWTLSGWLGPPESDSLVLDASPFVDRVLALDFSPDGTRLATGGGEPSRSGELLLWNLNTRALERTIADAHSDTVFAVEFSRDGETLLSGAADKFVKTFDVATGRHVRSYEGHTHHVLDVAWQADGSTLASAGADSAIKVWNVETGEQKQTITGTTKHVTALEFIGIGKNLVSASGDANVRLHDSSNGRAYRTLSGAGDFLHAVAATADERIVIAGGEGSVLRVWNGTDGKSIINFEPPESGSASAQQAAR